MNTIESTTSMDNHTTSDERKNSPPAFLDLADSAARLGTNLPDMSARVELKRLEHERQRLFQRKHFEDQMRALEERQAQELLSIPYDAGSGIQHLAVSAPTTPPRLNTQLSDGNISTTRPIRPHLEGDTVTKADKRKSVNYAPTVNLSPDLATGPTGNGFTRTAAKSMPASRRTSASEHDEDLAVHIQGLSLAGERSTGASPAPGSVSSATITRANGRYGDEQYASIYNAGMMLDEQLDKEMHNAMKNLPTSDNDKFASYPGKPPVALDLAQLTQGPSRSADPRDTPSEWPQFTRGTEGPLRTERRAVTNPNLTISAPSDDIANKLLGGTGSASGTPLLPQGPSSRRGSPHSLLENLSATTRSVPATPLGLPPNGPHLLKNPGTPHTPDVQSFNSRISTPMIGDNSLGSTELQGTISRMPQGTYENGGLGYNGIPGRDDYSSIYGINNGVEPRFNAYGFETSGRASVSSSSGVNGATGVTTGLYAQNGPRYGSGLPGRTPSGGDAKINGLHGPKHKRGEVDREFNRFAGTRLEDLQGEISGLCKDQHGCRYLQKKLEEGVPEHRDMIFRETFGHFADLMTDPFGNYLCQKLLEYSTDEQRSVICESVAQDLVNISLNMHGTRAVQKMIDFLSTRRQTDQRYNAQIHSIILALSLHVVVLIKDLNGNHVIQKCLNKLAPEDNQFIYNAVASNCVEVATHRHGCCVLQRCIDHASEIQRAQLVNEITYNALTLVQDPYGNYVVQYILDLNESRFIDALIRQFAGNVCALSVQKFSSNVIEKCIRVAEHSTRKMIIDELLNRSRLEKLLRDSYGNYCVQTALDYAEANQRALLVDGIRPVLPLIRNTPYGKRIQNKLQREQMDHFNGFSNQQALMALSHQGMVATPRHPGANPLADVYGSTNPALYTIPGQGGFGQAPLNSQMHSLQPQSIDGYVLQRNATHGQGLQQPGPGAFPAAAFNTLPAFGGMNTSLNDPYQRSTFGYGA